MKKDFISKGRFCTVLGWSFVIILLIVVVVLVTGCNHIRWEHIPQENENRRYFVIDIHSDKPDEKFDTFELASDYQKELTDSHDYVILYCNQEKKYRVYNMASPLSFKKYNEYQTEKLGMVRQMP
tara:strand:- start:524 stop:898 length:375 start_codon:yes stop_codon:yes gene_type:complete